MSTEKNNPTADHQDQMGIGHEALSEEEAMNDDHGGSPALDDEEV